MKSSLPLPPGDPAALDSRSVRTMLRGATHGDHVRINRHPLITGLTKPGYSLAAYRQVLIAYYHFYRSQEAAIARVLAGPDIPFSYLGRWKQPWLEEDLAHFGVDPDEAVNCPRQPVQVAPLAGKSDLVGVLYAIEGSSLGGQVVSGQLAIHLGLAPDRGARFFSGYGADTEARWQEYLAFAETLGDDAAARKDACAGALHVFRLIERLLDDYHARVR